MKINQLFTRHVERALLERLLACYGLRGLSDKRQFCKADLIKAGTVEMLVPVVEELRAHYLPCKAKVYLDGMDERKSITMLRQVLRLYDYGLLSKERNVNNKKIMYYQLIDERDRVEPLHLKVTPTERVLNFE